MVGGHIRLVGCHSPCHSYQLFLLFWAFHHSSRWAYRERDVTWINRIFKKKQMQYKDDLGAHLSSLIPTGCRAFGL